MRKRQKKRASIKSANLKKPIKINFLLGGKELSSVTYRC